MKQREGIITPLVYLGAAAKYVNKKGSNLEQISEKILALTESVDTTFQNKLGKYVSRLLIFFEDPGQVIRDLLIRVLEEKDPIRIRAKCYSIAGMIRGQGVGFIDKYDVVGRIVAIVNLSSLD